MAELVGRSGQLEELQTLLDSVVGGRSATAVVVGEAGVGKSCLLDHVAHQSHDLGWTVVRANGTEFEREIAFTGLASIVGRHLDALDRLDGRSAQALRAALSLEDAATTQLPVGVGLMNLLATMAEERPVLVVADDLHWLDDATTSALHFAIHRLDADRVGILMGSRPSGLPAASRPLPSIVLDDLGEAEIRELLEPLGVAPPVLEQFVELVGGNPLGLLELSRRLSTDQRAGIEPLPDPLPLSPRLADAFEPVLDALAESTRRALEVASIAGTSDVSKVLAALAAMHLDASELDVAEEAQLVVLGAGGLRWMHPLARAAVQLGVTGPRRRRIHLAVAGVLDPVRDAQEVAWHLAAGAVGPDEDVAARLADVGASAWRRGALGASAQAYARAAELSTTDESRSSRLLEMGRALWAGGTTVASVEPLHDAIRRTADPVARARIAVVLGQAMVWRRGVLPAVDLMVKHADVVADADPALSAELWVQATGALVAAGNAKRALVYATEAHEAAVRSGQPAAIFASGVVHGVARLLAGEPDAAAELEPIVDLTLGLLPTGEAGIESAAQLAGLAAGIVEDWERAEQLLNGVIDIGEQVGMPGLIAIATVIRSDARIRAGRWTEVEADLTNVMNIAEATGEVVLADFTAAALARVLAGRGEEERCRAHAERALATTRRLGLGGPTLWARHALAVLELGGGRPEQAVEHLDVIAGEARDLGIGEPGALWWQPDHVEALVACDRRAEAVVAVEQLADASQGRTFTNAATAWCRGMLDPSTEAGQFDVAVELFAKLGAPFERGRVLLARGRERRAAGDRVGGSRDVAEARSIFVRLGARAWLVQTESGTGTAGEPSRPTLASQLTPAELRVSMCVGGGATNRQAAEQLFVSVKTVDYHLQNIYRKLAITSRAQLAALVATETAAT